MALSDPYITAEEYYDRKKVAAFAGASDVDLADLESQILAICRLIDRETGNFLGFEKDAGATDRTYKPRRGGEYLDIGDDYYASVATITVDSVALVAADWELTPLNAALLPEAQPYRRVRHLTGSWAAETTVVVNGVAGWPAVPPAVVELTAELTAIFLLESPRSTQTLNEIDEVIKTSGAAQAMLYRLRRTYLNPAAVI